MQGTVDSGHEWSCYVTVYSMLWAVTLLQMAKLIVRGRN